MDKTEMVSVPRWALEFVMERADFWDSGPPGEGWPSDKMVEATEALEAALRGLGQ
jgi:hypothetical protein